MPRRLTPTSVRPSVIIWRCRWRDHWTHVPFCEVGHARRPFSTDRTLRGQEDEQEVRPRSSRWTTPSAINRTILRHPPQVLTSPRSWWQDRTATNIPARWASIELPGCGGDVAYMAVRGRGEELRRRTWVMFDHDDVLSALWGAKVSTETSSARVGSVGRLRGHPGSPQWVLFFRGVL